MRAERARLNAQRAFRRLRHSPGYTAAVVLSLGLGVGANTAVYGLLRETLLRRLPYPHGEELVAVGRGLRDGVAWESSTRDFEAWQDAGWTSRTLSGITWIRFQGRPSFGSIASDRVRGAKAAYNLPDILGIRPAYGRWFTSDEEHRLEPVAVVSHGLWIRSLGGDPSTIGQASIRVDDRVLTVIGVLPPGVGYPFNAEFWYPDPVNTGVEVIARMRNGSALSHVQRELRDRAPTVESGRRMGITSDILVVTLHDRLFGSNGPILRLLFAAALLVFVLACMNAANLTLARALERRRDTDIRVALGAGRRDLVLDVVSENVLLGLIGCVVGVILSAWAMDLLIRFRPPELSAISPSRLASALAALGAAGFGTIVVSFAPLGLLAGGRHVLRLGHRTAGQAEGASTRRIRAGLVVAQLAVAVLLTAASALLIRNMARLTSIETGFDRSQLVVVRLQFTGEDYREDAQRRAFVDQVSQRLRSAASASAVAMGPPPLIGGRGPGLSQGFDNVFAVRDSSIPDAPSRNVWVKYVDAAYFDTFRIPILAGRGLAESDDSFAPAVAVLNTEAQHLLFADGRALGQQLRGLPAQTAERTSGGRPITIVGIAGSVRQRDITIPPGPEIWLPLAQQRSRDVVYMSARTAGSVKELSRQIASTLVELDPRFRSWTVATMDDIVRASLAPQRYVLSAVGGFAFCALALAGLGLFSVMSYVTSVRRREFGIRLALGATEGQVLRLVLRQALGVSLAGVAIALPVGFGLLPVMARYIYESRTSDVAAFAAAAALLVPVTLAAAYLPAKRAAAVDPADTLQAD